MYNEYIYLDHAAATPVAPQVAEAMWPYVTQQFANPSARYPQAEQARAAVDWAHAEVAKAIGARPGEIIFTSGGSESDNVAIKGVAFAQRAKGNHIITSQIEHHAVLRACEYLEQRHGFRITYLPVDRYGTVDLNTLEAALNDETILVSIMLANNEVGTIQPIEQIAKLTRPRGIPLHSDAVQALGQMPLDVATLGVDLLTLSAHKYYGPKGIGALYLRRGTPLDPLIHGGHQERDRRAGTENVAGMVGMAVACQGLGAVGWERGGDTEKVRHGEGETRRRGEQHNGSALQRRERTEPASERPPSTQILRDQLISGVLADVPGAVLTGHPTVRLANSASFCFEGVAGETVLIALGENGVMCSSGSACAAGESEPSHVLTAMGIDGDLAQTAVRFSLGHSTTAAQIDRVVALLRRIVTELR